MTLPITNFSCVYIFVSKIGNQCMAFVETLAFKQNNGFSRPSHPICTPDSKKILVITCCPPALRRLLLGNRRVEGLTGGGPHSPSWRGKNKVKSATLRASHRRQTPGAPPVPLRLSRTPCPEADLLPGFGGQMSPCGPTGSLRQGVFFEKCWSCRCPDPLLSGGTRRADGGRMGLIRLSPFL